MPKKDTASAVLGMLSSVGSQTRPTAHTAEPPRPPAPRSGPDPNQPNRVTEPTAPATVVERMPDEGRASVSPLAPARTTGPAPDEAPRTLRLRPGTAQQLRAAWLEAKRDDVLLTAQDFASDLVDEALSRQRRRRTVSSTT